jgi:hypothetical protein
MSMLLARELYELTDLSFRRISTAASSLIIILLFIWSLCSLSTSPCGAATHCSSESDGDYGRTVPVGAIAWGRGKEGLDSAAMLSV